MSSIDDKDKGKEQAAAGKC